MSKFDSKIERMKAMMNYGLKSESNNQYKSVEYQREGADGKMYGIVREGANYYIKVSEKTNSPLKEDFDYIGGFRNRKDFEYSSYANALKNFDMKMTSIKESKKDVKDIITESWNLNESKGWTTEATDKMRDEINRQREIMNNAKKIFESNGKSYSTIKESCNKVDKDCAASQKNNIKNGDAKDVNGDPYTEKPKMDDILGESEQVLGWNDNADYLDTSKGTEIGDGSPFNKEPHSESEMESGVIDESATVMHTSQNQNSPEVGTSEVGDSAPFEKKVSNELSESTYCEEEDVEEPEFGEEEPMGDEFGGEETFEEEPEFGEEEMEITTEEEPIEGDDMESRISAMEALLSKIADKLGVDAFEDDELYPEESEEEPMGDEFDGEYDEIDFEDEEDDYEVYESVNFKKSFYNKNLNEDKMDYFGKHPAYQNSIAESIKRIMKKKI